MFWVGTSWKMNHDLSATQKYIDLLIQNSKLLKSSRVNFFIIPPFTSLMLFQQYKKKLSIRYGAQNMHWEDKGAYTGEISVKMLKSLGCSIVELGHAERFKLFNEKFELVNQKIKLALKFKLLPLICIGEKQMQLNLNKRKKLFQNQLDLILSNIKLNKTQKIILAYEPIWAIGKNKKAANIDYTNQSINFIKEYSMKKLNVKSNKIITMYGGSVDKKNCNLFLSSKFVDGIFIGRAALNGKNFIEICKEVL